MKIEVVVEYNSDGYLIYAGNFQGAFTRGKSLDEAMAKIPSEINQYLQWAENSFPPSAPRVISVVQTKQSTLQICDADSCHF